MTCIAPRRARNDSGIRAHIEQRLPVRDSLVYAVLGPPVSTRRPKTDEPAGLHGRKTLATRPGWVPDEVVLRVRALREFRGMTPSQIAEATGLKRSQVTELLKLTTRLHLEPKPEHAKG